MRIVYSTFWLIILILVVALTIVNTEPVTLHYYFGQRAIALPILIGICLVLGWLLGIISMLPTILRAKYARHQLQKDFNKLAEEVKKPE